jgi:4-alpha-glucanotransferase
MGLHRLYWIPDGLSGDKGVYVNYPAEELYAILSLESHRHNAGIVGENLGTVPPEVRTAMKKHNIQEMYVVQYEIVDDKKRTTLRRPPPDSVASLNTHDMPPFQAFLDGTDIPDRLDLKFLDAKGARQEKKKRMQLRKALTGFLKKRRMLKGNDVFAAATRFLAGSPAAIALINLEDVWKETNPQNVPATSKERPNWRRKLRYSLEELSKMPDVEALLRELNTLRS